MAKQVHRGILDLGLILTISHVPPSSMLPKTRCVHTLLIGHAQRMLMGACHTTLCRVPVSRSRSAAADSANTGGRRGTLDAFDELSDKSATLSTMQRPKGPKGKSRPSRYVQSGARARVRVSE